MCHWQPACYCRSCSRSASCSDPAGYRAAPAATTAQPAALSAIDIRPSSILTVSFAVVCVILWVTPVDYLDNTYGTNNYVYMPKWAISRKWSPMPGYSDRVRRCLHSWTQQSLTWTVRRLSHAIAAIRDVRVCARKELFAPASTVIAEAWNGLEDVVHDNLPTVQHMVRYNSSILLMFNN